MPEFYPRDMYGEELGLQLDEADARFNSVAAQAPVPGYGSSLLAIGGDEAQRTSQDYGFKHAIAENRARDLLVETEGELDAATRELNRTLRNTELDFTGAREARVLYDAAQKEYTTFERTSYVTYYKSAPFAVTKDEQKKIEEERPAIPAFGDTEFYKEFQSSDVLAAHPDLRKLFHEMVVVDALKRSVTQAKNRISRHETAVSVSIGRGRYEFAEEQPEHHYPSDQLYAFMYTIEPGTSIRRLRSWTTVDAALTLLEAIQSRRNAPTGASQQLALGSDIRDRYVDIVTSPISKYDREALFRESFPKQTVDFLATIAGPFGDAGVLETIISEKDRLTSGIADYDNTQDLLLGQWQRVPMLAGYTADQKVALREGIEKDMQAAKIMQGVHQARLAYLKRIDFKRLHEAWNEERIRFEASSIVVD